MYGPAHAIRFSNELRPQESGNPWDRGRPGRYHTKAGKMPKVPE